MCVWGGGGTDNGETAQENWEATSVLTKFNNVPSYPGFPKFIKYARKSGEPDDVMVYMPWFVEHIHNYNYSTKSTKAS